MHRVLLTDPIHPDGEERLQRTVRIVRLATDDPAELTAAMEAADVVIVRRQIPSGLFARCGSLRGAVRHGAGLDFIPVAEASDLGVAVTNVPDVNANSVAEHVVGLAITLSRRTARFDRGIRSGAWTELRSEAPTTQELRGRTAGLIGFGNIGRRVAEICHFGFGMTIRAVRRPCSQGPEWVGFCDLDELLRTSDFVVVACPLTSETKGLLDARRLSLMRKSAFLINVARGAIIDEAALVTALAQGRIAGAGLDVYQHQPLAPSHPLMALDNVVLTPHVAGITDSSMRSMSEVAVEDTLRILRGERPLHLANKDAWLQIAARWEALDCSAA